MTVILRFHCIIVLREREGGRERERGGGDSSLNKGDIHYSMSSDVLTMASLPSQNFTLYVYNISMTL